jgi:TetR/AcrR family fatty acid metabolism transcriptional regulator
MYDQQTASEDKRLRIIKGAIKVFSQQGFYKAKIEEIAEQAGVGKGTVYEYFASKEELFLEMFLYIEERCRGTVQRELPGVSAFSDKLQKMFVVIMRFLRDHREMGKILFAGSPPVSDDTQRVLREKNQKMLDDLSGMLEEAAAKGEIRPVNVGVAAHVIFGTLLFVAAQVLFSEDEGLDYNRLAQEINGIFLQGLGLAERRPGRSS